MIEKHLSHEKVRVVSATRRAQSEFFDGTALGRSLYLTRPLYPNLELRLFCNNSLGLAHLYNIALREAADNPAILVFVHDDVYFCDFFWPDRIAEGLNAFDIIGIAGNRRRLPMQSGWNTIDAQRTLDDPSWLSGTLAPPALALDLRPVLSGGQTAGRGTACGP